MPTPRRSTSADLDALADAVTRLRRALRRVVRSDVPFESVPMAQIEVMQLLAERPGLRAGEVGEILLLAPTTVSTLVGALLSQELIERQADPSDRRAWRLLLTESGTDLLTEWQQSNRRVMRDAAAHLSADDLQALRDAVPALSKLVGQLDSSRDAT
ncbi:MAG TPA: MarR family winged helix-turn-helix transcriptional regulator [Mycobacteriales bacterium]|jgi:DNA-binding MarR family transcriptional regulator|nr:MarR family winged helix-turn-helix transcriptional regulator [Mycobacteriales bacterium]